MPNRPVSPRRGIWGLDRKTGRKVFIPSLNPIRTPEEKTRLLAQIAELQKKLAERNAKQKK